ncbi:uncharacterized protein [Onthophagus taurus]|uniref:uncharacterized protein n=1 Tax=Onthophagus taurus TaxID=166361 RepID=UPI0039BDE7A7
MGRNRRYSCSITTLRKRLGKLRWTNRASRTEDDSNVNNFDCELDTVTLPNLEIDQPNCDDNVNNNHNISGKRIIYGNVEEISQDELIRRREVVFRLLNKTRDKARIIEEETRGQHTNPNWKQHRLFRITASNFGLVCKRRVSTSPKNLLKILLENSFRGNKATRYGCQYENTALKEFEAITGFHVDTCGLYVGQGEFFFLGASPDGIIHSRNVILEIKCPYNLRDMSVEDGVQAKKIDMLELRNGQLKLKTLHKYYYQIQGQLHVTEKKKCYFIVWSPIGPPHIEEIDKGDDFWNRKMKGHLATFFSKHLLEEIIKQPIYFLCEMGRKTEFYDLLSGEFYFLGASQVGVIHSDNSIIEVKCPYYLRNISIEDGIRTKKNNIFQQRNEELKLKTQYNYFYQIQGQLHITKKEKCYFVVWTPTGPAIFGT